MELDEELLSRVRLVENSMPETYLDFEILWRDEVMAHVKVAVHNQTVEVNQYTYELFKRPFPKEDSEVTVTDVNRFLEDRCVPRGRTNIDELLDMASITHYDPIQIIKETHGIILEDFMWIRFKGEDLVYDDVKSRDD